MFTFFTADNIMFHRQETGFSVVGSPVAKQLFFSSFPRVHCTLNPNSCKCIIRPCLTAAILSRETKKALFYHAKPHPHGFHCEAWRGKTKLFWSPGTIWPPCDKGECAAEKKANGYCNYDWYKHQLTQFVQENVLFSCYYYSLSYRFLI